MKRDPAERAWGRLTKLQRLRVLVNLKGTEAHDVVFARMVWEDIPESARDRFRVMLAVHLEITKALGGVHRHMGAIESEANAAYERVAGRAA